MEPVVRVRHVPNPTVAGVDADRHSSDPLSSSRQSMLDTEAASPAIAQCVRSRAPDPVIPVPPALGYQPRIVLVPLTSAPLGPGCPRDSELQTPGSLRPPSCRCPVDRRMAGWDGGGQHSPPPTSFLRPAYAHVLLVSLSVARHRTHVFVAGTDGGGGGIARLSTERARRGRSMCVGKSRLVRLAAAGLLGSYTVLLPTSPSRAHMILTKSFFFYFSARFRTPRV
jgi:hypothetical protein